MVKNKGTESKGKILVRPTSEDLRFLLKKFPQSKS
jgi:hypothetical protein